MLILGVFVLIVNIVFLYAGVVHTEEASQRFLSLLLFGATTVYIGLTLGGVCLGSVR